MNNFKEKKNVMTNL